MLFSEPSASRDARPTNTLPVLLCLHPTKPVPLLWAQCLAHSGVNEQQIARARDKVEGARDKEEQIYTALTPSSGFLMKFRTLARK